MYSYDVMSIEIWCRKWGRREKSWLCRFIKFLPPTLVYKSFDISLANSELVDCYYTNLCSLKSKLNSRFSPFATRATLLSSECLKGRGLYGEAAKQLIRMSGEDSDLRSAVLLEQAAYCFLHCPRPVMFRKYAFHMVLAGNRYSKASHKNHSMRCYYQAHQVIHAL